MDMDSDRVLLMAGLVDKEAVGILYERYRDRIFAWLMCAVMDRDLAETNVPPVTVSGQPRAGAMGDPAVEESLRQAGRLQSRVPIMRRLRVEVLAWGYQEAGSALVCIFGPFRCVAGTRQTPT